MTNVTPEYVEEIIDKFEMSDENKQNGVLGIEGNFLTFSVFSGVIFTSSFVVLGQSFFTLLCIVSHLALLLIQKGANKHYVTEIK